MISITSANQIKLNSGACINVDVSDVELGVRALVGHHHYYRMGIFEAQTCVQESLAHAGLTGWRAGIVMRGEGLPDGAIRVGQVKVRSGDPEFPLYVMKAK